MSFTVYKLNNLETAIAAITPRYTDTSETITLDTVYEIVIPKSTKILICTEANGTIEYTVSGQIGNGNFYNFKNIEFNSTKSLVDTIEEPFDRIKITFTNKDTVGCIVNYVMRSVGTQCQDTDTIRSIHYGN